jgi:hypothetical protein
MTTRACQLTINMHFYLYRKPSLRHTHATGSRSSCIFNILAQHLPISAWVYSVGYGSHLVATHCKSTLWFEGWFCRRSVGHFTILLVPWLSLVPWI